MVESNPDIKISCRGFQTFPCHRQSHLVCSCHTVHLDERWMWLKVILTWRSKCSQHIYVFIYLAQQLWLNYVCKEDLDCGCCVAGFIQSLYHSPSPDLLDKVKADLERESAARAEVETKYRESEASLKSIQAKSKQLIGALQQRVEEAEMGKVKNVSVVKHTHTGACVHIQHVHTNMY